MSIKNTKQICTCFFKTSFIKKKKNLKEFE